MTTYLGLTWDHPRGTAALRRAAEDFSSNADGDGLVWESQPLEGFESHPIEELCAAYDLVVLDHPHLGDALAAGCLRPLEEVFPEGLVRAWAGGAVGASGGSYRFAGRHWAAPLDAATQVAAGHRAALPELPGTWAEVIELAGRAPVALSLGGPHALLTFLSLCNALGEAPATEPGRPLVSEETGRRAVEAMEELFARTDPATAALNPIALLGRIAEGRLVYCPLVYGYVNYSRRDAGAPVRFADVPRLLPGGPLGSVLGGTGLAVTRRARLSPELVEHLAGLLSPQAQTSFLPAHEGQPGSRQAWTDPAADADACGFYQDTLATTEAAWVRPRLPGWPVLQTALSARLRDGLLAGEQPSGIVTALLDAWERHARPMPSAAAFDPAP
ncbi:carbohydrate ABC transporter substrate-binding protein [Streptomyces sp. ITFR-6]|uniref:carbohydrate ABC transporter substrate-binding protein n=1 Tax=Streptomyces sp. ITFR-6 TaxID=3075197 RepID=UPI00288B3035|nr:carbohydrate ABC transporter substrate-binding protein [Streptomyces sp. ITFR-6]WNI34499.1 carbohydrate ABC transporter substrate-binding protein [Streptomyces sp. ITFR-6]